MLWRPYGRCVPRAPNPGLFMRLLLRTSISANGSVVRANSILNVSRNTPPVEFTLLLALEPYAGPRYEAS
jgi:hypothetical protein